ncbi:outer membrane beta-barrel protein [Chitinimonas koreensis]|uniref:outer membrane beta-barrel protein n=1 Tax=Chitinimonas koreensis TaxID=356302 RepID=UPI00041954F1|nr:outer membrane beta-barrel protein [Chitinimonas koreensis]QNM95242.1 outer membrane beta-barrel protein [Chitinimonas koreensis]
MRRADWIALPHCGLAAALLGAAPAWAAPPADAGSPLQLSAGVRAVHDDNLTRTPEAQSDRYLQSSALLGYAPRFSGQQLKLAAQLSHYDYDRRSDLDGSAYDLSAGWSGRLGERFGGELGRRQRRDRVDLSDAPAKDWLRQRNDRAGLRYGIDGAFSAGLAAERVAQRHSLAERQPLDYDDRSAKADLRYRSGRGSAAKVTLAQGRRDYRIGPARSGPGTPGPAPLDYDYRELGAEVDWQAGARTRLEAGLTRFRREDAAGTDDGTDANASAHWAPTAKLAFDLGYALTHPASRNDFSDPAEETVLTAAASWQWRAKVALRASVHANHRDYREQPAGTRADRLLGGKLGMLYQPLRTVEVDAEIGHERRDSNFDLYDYEGEIVSLGLRYRY